MERKTLSLELGRAYMTKKETASLLINQGIDGLLPVPSDIQQQEPTGRHAASLRNTALCVCSGLLLYFNSKGRLSALVCPLTTDSEGKDSPDMDAFRSYALSENITLAGHPQWTPSMEWKSTWSMPSHIYLLSYGSIGNITIDAEIAKTTLSELFHRVNEARPLLPSFRRTIEHLFGEEAKKLNKEQIHRFCVSQHTYCKLPDEEQFVLTYNTKMVNKYIMRSEQETSDPLYVRLRDSIKHVIQECSSTQWNKENLTQSLDLSKISKGTLAIITSNKRIMYERATGNTDRKTFDFIRMRMGICTKDTFPGRNEYIMSHGREFALVALSKIQDSKIFQRKGVPVGFLQLDRMGITQQNELELIFSLKQI